MLNHITSDLSINIGEKAAVRDVRVVSKISKRVRVQRNVKVYTGRKKGDYYCSRHKKDRISAANYRAK